MPTKGIRPPSIKVRRAVALIASGEAKSQTDAAKIVGMDRVTLNRALHTPAGQALIDREARRNLSAGRLRASRRMMELVESPSTRVAFESSRFVLGTSGIGVQEKSGPLVQVNFQAGYILDLRPQPRETESEATRVIEATPVEAEALHELSGPARAALDRVPEPMTGFQPDARWAGGAVPGPPVELEPPSRDGFEEAIDRRERREQERGPRPKR